MKEQRVYKLIFVNQKKKKKGKKRKRYIIKNYIYSYYIFIRTTKYRHFIQTKTVLFQQETSFHLTKKRFTFL